MKAGKISEIQLKRSVLKEIKNEKHKLLQGPGIAHDYGAYKTLYNEQVVTMANSTLWGRDGGYYAGIKALNKLCASGAMPVGIMINALLPARGNEGRIKQLTQEVQSLCEAEGISYLGGHTELIESLRQPAITAVAVGERQKGYRRVEDLHAGETIICVGAIALETTRMVAQNCFDQLNQRYSSVYLDGAIALSKNLSLTHILQELSNEECYIHDCSTGGIFGGLWEIGEGAGLGITAYIREIPIYQETIELCEFYDMNPYMALSGGCALMVTEKGEEILEKIKKYKIPCGIIGQTTANNDRIVMHDEDYRYLTPPRGDDLYKIFMN